MFIAQKATANLVYFFIFVKLTVKILIQTRFQKSWDTVQIVNKKGMQ